MNFFNAQGPMKYRLSTSSRFSALLALFLAVSACSSQPKTTTSAGEFVPQVRSGGIKLFSYTEKMIMPKVGPIHQVADPQAEAARRAKYLPATQLQAAQIRLNRDERLKSFCPNGYTEIEKYAVLDEIVIRGECQYTEDLAAKSSGTSD
ncbi:hypothetical protein IB286_00250 [Spongiibacter sp. KMU-158]|uniref:Lipoprotein n=1 Tax=Spongiibacter pelagi TaxID=2760804 RepID=A0A927BXL4_9GAMM|nr:hypothetical protein [Spongiibacter pelagi]MBD2857415.1 hypothetical protein [Spongiibacter pelagi]